VLVEVKGTTLSVTDSCPGIPASEREWVFDRFHRLAGQESEGSGLGLSIVARIAERHGATIRLADGVGSACGAGLRVSVEFPAV
jgi:signal transduction histidine kinase